MYYLALYKPRGYVTTASDELGRKTAMTVRPGSSVTTLMAQGMVFGRGPAAGKKRK